MTIELSEGLMWLIGLSIFWLGFCFVVGMRAFGQGTIESMTKAIMAAQQLIKDHAQH